ncbi:uncharacterized protein LOC142504986 [Primulina tabacum]|uniref:uncharacterized protein LOC142504986 n=1 Tax=Primulina tabacum TaxID=48773 RepID=UPI003F599247
MNHDREDGEGGELPKRHHNHFVEDLERNTVGSVLSKWMKRKKILPSYLQYPEFLFMMLLLIHARLDENIASIKGASFIWSLIRSFSLWWEFEGRREKSEKFASILASALTVAATESLVVWLLAPVNYHYSPNSGPRNVFEATKYKFEKFDVGKQIFCLVRSGTNLFMLGTLIKAAEVVVNGDQACFGRSTDIILGNGMFFGIDCNIRHQILCGLDRLMVDYFGDTKFALALCAILRATNAWIGSKRCLNYALSYQPAVPKIAAHRSVVCNSL